MGKRLYKSSNDKVLAGVCGGIGEYFDVDPVLIRILWVVSAFFGGVGVLAYIIAAIIMPAKEDFDRQETYGSTYRRTNTSGTAGTSGFSGPNESTRTNGGGDGGAKRHTAAGRDNNVLIGAVLIGLGAFFMLREFMPWVSGGILAAALFISMGIFILVRGTGGTK